jgi:RNA polymerase sigma-70 factor (ECF subfamily)
VDDEARKIVERYSAQAYAVAFRLTGNHADAWDLVQNAMLRVLKSYGTYDPTYKVEQWLARIIRNLYIDRLRAEARRREDSLDRVPAEERRSPAEVLPDPGPGPEDAASAASDGAAVHRALGELPVELRAAVALVDLEGYSYEDAAKALEIPASTLGVRVFRGRKLLKEKLAPVLGR